MPGYTGSGSEEASDLLRRDSDKSENSDAGYGKNTNYYFAGGQAGASSAAGSAAGSAVATRGTAAMHGLEGTNSALAQHMFHVKRAGLFVLLFCLPSCTLLIPSSLNLLLSCACPQYSLPITYTVVSLLCIVFQFISHVLRRPQVCNSKFQDLNVLFNWVKFSNFLN